MQQVFFLYLPQMLRLSGKLGPTEKCSHNSKLAVMVLRSTKNLGNTLTSHLSFYFTFPMSQAALPSSSLSASPSSISFSISVFPNFLL